MSKKMERKKIACETIVEGAVELPITVPDIVSKEMQVFYNPKMQFNRDMTLFVLSSEAEHLQKKLRICDPLAGSGIRALRILKELPRDIIETLFVNDFNPQFPTFFSQVLKRNGLSDHLHSASAAEKLVVVRNQEASVFLHGCPPQDYIDVDPFGTPVPFLDAAVRRVRPGGILAVTATDTAALCGTSVRACRRKYYAEPLRCAAMKEIALRILIRRVQLAGACYNLCFEPVLSYPDQHYFRVFFRRTKGGSAATDALLKLHAQLAWDADLCSLCSDRSSGTGVVCGPLWTGPLHDVDFVKRLVASASLLEGKGGKTPYTAFLSRVAQECAFPLPGFFDIHALCKRRGFEVPSFAILFDCLKEQGFSVSRTVFSLNGIRTTAPAETVVSVLETLQKR